MHGSLGRPGPPSCRMCAGRAWLGSLGKRLFTRQEMSIPSRPAICWSLWSSDCRDGHGLQKQALMPRKAKLIILALAAGAALRRASRTSRHTTSSAGRRFEETMGEGAVGLVMPNRVPERGDWRLDGQMVPTDQPTASPPPCALVPSLRLRASQHPPSTALKFRMSAGMTHLVHIGAVRQIPLSSCVPLSNPSYFRAEEGGRLQKTGQRGTTAHPPVSPLSCGRYLMHTS